MRFPLLLSGLLIALPTAAQTGDAASPPLAPKLGGWSFSASADGYITANGNSPSTGANQLYNYNTQSGQPELSLAKIVIDKSDQLFGLHLDAGFGETLRLIHATDPAAIDHPALRYIEQAYLIVKPDHTHGAEFDFGQFISPAGAEVVEADADWNYSRSLLFAWAIPAYHFGFKSTVPITKGFSAGVQLVNAWNTVWGNNELTNVGIVSTYTRPRYVWSANYYTGPNHVGTRAGKRNLLDTTLLLTPTPKLSAYVNLDYGQDNRVVPHTGADRWAGAASAGRYQLRAKLAAAARVEWYDDANGFTTGLAQRVKEVTFTGEYKQNAHVLSRLELRHDWSDKAFYADGPKINARRQQTTLTLGVILSAGPLK